MKQGQAIPSVPCGNKPLTYRICELRQLLFRVIDLGVSYSDKAIVTGTLFVLCAENVLRY